MYQSGSGMQEVIQMCSSFDSNKSTKGASKLRRDLINGEIANLRDLLPLPSSTRQRLSQLQLMALVCVYVRKANYFQQVFKRYHELGHPYSTPNIGFSKVRNSIYDLQQYMQCMCNAGKGSALSGFLIMMTQNGKLLYISDNAAEYLGHSMEDLLIHGDSVYDIIDKADHGTVQTELLRSTNSQNPPGEETRLFLCRMNVSRNARRQMRFGDQKVVLLQGHFLSYLPLCSRNEPVFVATCTPVAMPETRECVVQGATNIFTTIHAMDMKFMHIDRNGEYYLGYTRSELGGASWYQLIHWNYMREAQSKHRLISQSEQEKSCILLLRLQTRSGDWIWVHCVLQVKDGSEATQQQQQSVIVATNQVLSNQEAAVMRANAWLYHYYTVQTKLQYGLAYPEATATAAGSPTGPASAAAARLAAAAYFPNPQLMNINYSSHQATQSHSHHHLHHHTHAHHHQVSPDTGGYASSAVIMPPPLHSPHNGSYTPGVHGHHPFHPAHPHSAYEVGKESPIDFSLAASTMFDFTMGTGAYAPPTSGTPSYWGHHHHTHNYGGRLSECSPLSAASASTSSSTSAMSPQAWSSMLPSSSSVTSHQTSHQQSSTTPSSTSISNLSPTSVGGGSATGSTTSRRRMKKNTEVVNDSSSPPLSSNEPATVNRLSSGGGLMLSNTGGNGGNCEGSSVITMTTPFPYHARPRSFYKLLGSDEDTHSVVKEENITMMACPLTPSPIWEGQTQRVPDLQHQFHMERDGYTHCHNIVMAGPADLTHCVPTYQPYLPFGPTGSQGLLTSTSNSFGFSGVTMMETGSPNKENRFPPTPESDQDHCENEENRPLKWETL